MKLQVKKKNSGKTLLFRRDQSIYFGILFQSVFLISGSLFPVKRYFFVSLYFFFPNEMLNFNSVRLIAFVSIFGCQILLSIGLSSCRLSLSFLRIFPSSLSGIFCTHRSGRFTCIRVIPLSSSCTSIYWYFSLHFQYSRDKLHL